MPAFRGSGRSQSLRHSLFTFGLEFETGRVEDLVEGVGGAGNGEAELNLAVGLDLEREHLDLRIVCVPTESVVLCSCPAGVEHKQHPFSQIQSFKTTQMWSSSIDKRARDNDYIGTAM